MELTAPRFSMLPLFLLAAAFSFFAPLYWTHVEAPAGTPGAIAYEHQEIYGRLLPAIHYGYARLNDGELPLWAPGQYCGIPFLANPIHGLFQPLNLVFYLAPPIQALALHAFLGLFLMALFFSLFHRAMGTAYIPSAIAGMVYAFCGATATVMSRPELLGVLVWSPLLYWCIYAYSSAPKRYLVVVGGAVTALMILAGAMLLALAMAAGALLYGAVRVLIVVKGTGRSRLGMIGGLGGMALIGLLFSSVAWAPALPWWSGLDHPLDAFFPAAWAGHLPGTAGEVPAAMLAPHGTALPSMLYVGVIPLMLIPAAALYRQRRFEVLFFAAAALGWLGVAVWGSDGAPATDLYKIFVFPGIVAVAALAGFGADRLFLTGRDPRSPLIWGAVVLSLATGLILLLAGTAGARGPIALSIVFLLPFFILRVRWLGAVCGICVVFFNFVDLRDACASVYQHPYAGDPNWLQDCLPAIKEAEAQALGERILALPVVREAELPANIGLIQPVDCAGGAYWPLTHAQAVWWGKLAPYLAPGESGSAGTDGGPFYPRLLNFMGVRVIVGEAKKAWMDTSLDHEVHLRDLRQMGRLHLWKNESGFGRVRWVPAWEPVTGIEAAIEALASPDFSGERTCVVEARGRAYEGLKTVIPAGDKRDEVSPDLATAVIKRESPEDLVISTAASAAGILVVSDSYDTAWKARLDGKRVPVLRVNGLFRGVLIPAGDHLVEFNYAPVSVTLGLLLTGLSLLGTVGWGLVSVVRFLYRTIRPAPARDS